jgi:hypothetical protein
VCSQKEFSLFFDLRDPSKNQKLFSAIKTKPPMTTSHGHRLLFLGIFLSFVLQTAAFAPPTSRCHPSGLAKQATTIPHQHYLYHDRQVSSSSLFYRDRQESEEALTDNLASPSRKEEKAPSSKDNENGVSMPLIRAIWYNEAAIFLFATAIWAGASLFGNTAMTLSNLHWSHGSFVPLFDWHFTPMRVLEGIAATIPMISLGMLVEQSDNRDASHVNFSTTNMVISLFGRRRTAEEPFLTSTHQMMGLSAAIALSTAISEEMVFRAYVPAAILGVTHSLPLALVGQAVLFGLGHLSPRSTLGENKIVVGLQLLNGLWYGLVYLWTGGDILPCIIAHILYDMHVFCGTWSAINKQMDYTQHAFQERLVDSEEREIQKIQQQAGPSLNNDTLSFARRFFYAFDYEHKGSLSLPDVQRAVSYAFLQDKVVPEPAQVSQVFANVLDTRKTSFDRDVPPERLSVSEFLRVLFSLKSQAWAQ